DGTTTCNRFFGFLPAHHIPHANIAQPFYSDEATKRVAIKVEGYYAARYTGKRHAHHLFGVIHPGLDRSTGGRRDSAFICMFQMVNLAKLWKTSPCETKRAPCYEPIR